MKNAHTTEGHHTIYNKRWGDKGNNLNPSCVGNWQGDQREKVPENPLPLLEIQISVRGEGEPERSGGYNINLT